MNLQSLLEEIKDENKKLMTRNAFLLTDNEMLQLEKNQLIEELGIFRTQSKGA